MSRWTTLGAALALTILAACGAQPPDPAPPDITYGQELCTVCGMLISEPRFAAALILEDGDPVLFDDAGEMFRYPQQGVRAWFVHDYGSEAWIHAREATYVVHPSIASPMGTGLAAFEQAADAQALAASFGAGLRSFDQLMADPPGLMH